MLMRLVPLNKTTVQMEAEEEQQAFHHLQVDRGQVEEQPEAEEPVNEADPIVECPSCKGDGHWCGTMWPIHHYVCVGCSATFTDNIKTGVKALDRDV